MTPSEEKVELVERTVSFQGYFRVGTYLFRHSLFKGGQSKVISREVFETGMAAGVLPYDPVRDEVLLIRQFRAGAYAAKRHPWTWELVAGRLESGETTEAMVRREAVEEAGVVVRDVIPVHNVLLSPGAVSEACAIYLGRVDTSQAGGVFGVEEEDEDILVQPMPFAEAMALLDRDGIDNAVTVVALQWLALHREEVRNRWR
jgi:ADP-ribose pyrophosphatase